MIKRAPPEDGARRIGPGPQSRGFFVHAASASVARRGGAKSAVGGFLTEEQGLLWRNPLRDDGPPAKD